MSKTKPAKTVHVMKGTSCRDWVGAEVEGSNGKCLNPWEAGGQCYQVCMEVSRFSSLKAGILEVVGAARTKDCSGHRIQNAMFPVAKGAVNRESLGSGCEGAAHRKGVKRARGDISGFEAWMTAHDNCTWTLFF